jgi:hypothetical protein
MEGREFMRLPATFFLESAYRVTVRRVSLCLLVVAGFASTSQAAIERTLERSFIVSRGCNLEIDTCQGAIRVEPSADNQLHLLVRQSMAVETEADADRRLHDLDFQVEQTGSQISVKARYRRAAHWLWESWPPVGLGYVVKVPSACNLDLVTAEGDINVGSLQGTLVARTGNGAIFTGEIDGNVQATSTRGDVAVTACSGELTLIAKAGNVLVGRAGGLAKISGAGGTIEVQRARGNLHVEGDNADLKIGFVYPLTEPCELSTAGGDIEVFFDPRSACTISASASVFGAVKSKNLPLKIEAGKMGSSRIIATLNSGGPKISVNASGGNVSLNGSEP